MSKPTLPAFDPADLAESNATSYPEKFRTANSERWNRRLGDHVGLTNFGVNLTRIVPGAQSSARHAHSKQDEFIWSCRVRSCSRPNEGAQTLRPGMCAASRPLRQRSSLHQQVGRRRHDSGGRRSPRRSTRSAIRHRQSRQGRRRRQVRPYPQGRHGALRRRAGFNNVSGLVCLRPAMAQYSRVMIDNRPSTARSVLHGTRRRAG